MATRILPLLVSALTVSCSPGGPQVDVESELKAVLAADRAFSRTAPDLDAFVSYYAPGAVTLAGSEPAAEGLAAIRHSTAEMFDAPGFALTWNPSRAEVSACGDMAYTLGTYLLTSNDAAGIPRPVAGKYVTLWKKQADGSWKVIVDAPSENEAPAARPFALAADATRLDPDHYQVEFENEHVRVLRIRYGPGEKSVMHEHPAGVAVLLTEQNARMHAPDGTSEDDRGPAGAARWLDAGRHLPENLSDGPLEVVLVELKKAGD